MRGPGELRGSPGFVTVNPIIFNEMGESDAGWKTVYNKDSSEGVQRNDVLPEKEHEGIKLRPRPVPKPDKKASLQNQVPGNIGRPESQMTEYTVRNRPERAPVLFQPSSPSAKEFYYAPNDLVGKRVRGFQTSDDVAPLPHDWPEESPTNYGDSDLNLELGQDGYSRVEKDSNFSRKPKTWRFRTRDNDLGLQQVRDEPLPDLRDVGISEMVYPLQGKLRPIVFGATPRQKGQKKKLAKKKKEAPKKVEPKKEAAEPEAKPKAKQAEETWVVAEPWTFGEPKLVLEQGKQQVGDSSTPPAFLFKVEVQGDQEQGAPIYMARFRLTQNPRSFGKVWFDESNIEVFEYPAEDIDKPFPEAKRGPKEISESISDALQADSRVLQRASAQVRKVFDVEKKPGSYRGNILDDPALASLRPKMLDQEKLFTTIRKWEGDNYVIGADKLDSGMKQVLAQNPEGEGHYFSWKYTSPEESEKGADKDVEDKGYTISDREGVLFVQRLGGWDQAEAEVMNKRRSYSA